MEVHCLICGRIDHIPAWDQFAGLCKRKPELMHWYVCLSCRARCQTEALAHGGWW